MKKRMIALLCALTLLAGMLAGCGGEKETPTIKTPDITSITPAAPAAAPSTQTPETPQTPVQTSSDTYVVNAYASHWSDVRIWAWSASQENLFDAWPGESMQNDGGGWYSYEVPNWVDYVIINGNGGANQTADLQVAAQDLWIIVFDDDSAAVTYLDPAVVEDPWGDSQIIAPPYGDYSAEPMQPAQPDSGYTADLGGWWEQVYLKDGSMSLNVSALCFSETVYNCTELTVNMDVTMNAGTSCKDWQLWGRSGGSFVKLAKIPLPAGSGYTSQTVTFASPVTFDALVVTPTVLGGYSFSIAMSVTDVWSD